jgi:putative chitinase
MAKISIEGLRKVCPTTKLEVLQLYIQYINDFIASLTKDQAAFYIAHVAHECQRFTRMEENLMYSAPRLVEVFHSLFKTPADAAPYDRQPIKIASRVYANRYGNGDEASQDGYNFRGRGAIMVTFKDNYRALSKWLYKDERLLTDVTARDSLSKIPELAIKVANWYWTTRNLSALCAGESAHAMLVTTKIINGGTNGYDDRLSLWKIAVTVVEN